MAFGEAWRMTLKNRMWARTQRPIRVAVAAATMASVVAAPVVPSFAQETQAEAKRGHTTPIDHVILIIGENRTFDHVFATYRPQHGEKVNNLLSEGIVNADGTPGPNYSLAAQSEGHDTSTYEIAPRTKTSYVHLPPAATDGAPSQASDNNPPPFATLAGVKAAEGE